MAFKTLLAIKYPLVLDILS